MSAIEPARVKLAVPLPATVTLPPLVAERLPEPTEKVAVTVPLAASISAKLMPVSALATSSVTPMEPGAVMTGASLTPVTATVAAIDTALLSTPLLLVPPLSVMLVSVTTRLVVPGASLALR